MSTTKKHKIHRGEALQAVVKRKGKIGQTVKKAGYSRSTYYSHIADANLPFDIIEKYGKAMDFDFTEIFPDMVTLISFNHGSGGETTIQQALKERDQWRDKYLFLLERYNKLIEEKLNLD